jgi:tetratricopeptide (TPR) repeat protein
MRSILILAVVFAASVIIGCSNAAAPVQTNSNGAAANTQNDRPQTMIAHSSENQAPVSNVASGNTRTKWTQSGDVIDTAELDKAVTQAANSVKAKPADEAAKKALGEAYFKRGVALTGARQYASALGDYRKALKYEPANQEAKQWIDQILGIYASMNKEAPKEGEEPPPLPYKAQK